MSVYNNCNILWKILWELISNFFVSVVYITYSLHTQVITVSSENNSKKKSLKELNKTRFYFQFSSITQLCLTLCDPMNHTMPGLPVHHQLSESTQTHVHWVGNAIQPSHPLSSPSPPALSLDQHQSLFKWDSSLHQVAKVLEFQLQHQSFQWTLRTDLLLDGLIGSPCSPRGSRVFSNIIVQNHQLFDTQLSL